jgi:hypothetical protein
MHGNKVEGCARSITVKKLDADLWEKLEKVLTNDEDFEYRVNTRVEQLRLEAHDAQARIDRIRADLGKVTEERQWVITQARKKTINEHDMEQQIGMLDAEEDELRRELADKSLLVGGGAARLLAFANQYRAEMHGKLGWLNGKPQTPEEAAKQFAARRHIVENIVKRVDVDKDRKVSVTFEFDLTAMDEIKDPQHWSQEYT